MTKVVHTRIAAFSGLILLSLAVFVLAISTAQAAGSSAPLRGGADAAYAAANLTPLRGGADAAYAALDPVGTTARFGRGGVFVTPTPAAASTAAVIGGIAVSALAIALVAFLALGGSSSRRGELAPVTSLEQSPSVSPAKQYDDRERKAA